MKHKFYAGAIFENSPDPTEIPLPNFNTNSGDNLGVFPENFIPNVLIISDLSLKKFEFINKKFTVSNFSDMHYQDMKGTLPHFEKKSFDIQLKCFLRTQNLEEKPPKVICFISLI